MFKTHPFLRFVLFFLLLFQSRVYSEIELEQIRQSIVAEDLSRFDQGISYINPIKYNNFGRLEFFSPEYIFSIIIENLSRQGEITLEKLEHYDEIMSYYLFIHKMLLDNDESGAMKMYEDYVNKEEVPVELKSMTHSIFGDYAYLRGDYKKSVQHYKKTIEHLNLEETFKEEYFGIQNRIGWCYKKMGEKKKAIQIWEQFDPITIKKKIKFFQEKESHVLKGLNKNAFFFQCLTYIEMGETERAMELVEIFNETRLDHHTSPWESFNSLTSSPADALNFFFLRGMLYYNTGKFESAQKDFSEIESLGLKPDLKVAVRFMQGLTSLQLGDYTQSSRQFNGLVLDSHEKKSFHSTKFINRASKQPKALSFDDFFFYKEEIKEHVETQEDLVKQGRLELKLQQDLKDYYEKKIALVKDKKAIFLDFNKYTIDELENSYLNIFGGTIGDRYKDSLPASSWEELFSQKSRSDALIVINDLIKHWEESPEAITVARANILLRLSRSNRYLSLSLNSFPEYFTAESSETVEEGFRSNNMYGPAHFVKRIRMRYELYIKSNSNSTKFLKKSLSESSSFELFSSGTYKSTLIDFGNYYLALSLRQMKNFESAKKYFNELVNKLPKEEELRKHAYYQLGSTWFQERKYLKAIEVWQRFIKDNPLDPLVESAKYWIAFSYFMEKQYPQSRKVLDKMANLYIFGEYKEKVGLLNAWNWFKEANYPNAINAFNAYLNEFVDGPSWLESHVTLGDSYYNQGNLKKAFESYEKLISIYLDDKNSVVPDKIGPLTMAIEKSKWVFIAEEKYREGEYFYESLKDKLKTKRRAMSYENSQKVKTTISLTLSEIHSSGNKVESAIKEIKKKITPMTPTLEKFELNYKLAELHFESKDYKETKKILQKILKDTNPETHIKEQFNLGLTYIKVQDYKNAKRIFYKILYSKKKTGSKKTYAWACFFCYVVGVYSKDSSLTEKYEEIMIKKYKDSKPTNLYLKNKNQLASLDYQDNFIHWVK